MRTELEPGQIEHYRTQGFLGVEGFLSSGELEELRGAVEEAVASLGKRKVSGNSNWFEGDSYYDRVFTQRLNLWKVSAAIRRYVQDAGLGQMLARLSGASGVRIWHDQALIKEAFANPTAWHLDNPIWSFHSRQAISIWIALDDATLHNGCLYFLPGSHELVGYDNADIGEEMAALFSIYPGLKEIESVALPMAAGSCSFHNGLVAHAAGANMTRGRRRAMTCAYMPEGSTFNGKPNILPPAYLESLRVGDVLDQDEYLPRL